MSPSLPLLCLLLLLLIFHQNLSLADASIDETCKAVANNGANVPYDFCVKSLESDPESRSADPEGLAIIATKLSKTKCSSTKSKIDDLLKKATDHNLKMSLDTCSSLYEDLTPYLNDSVDALKSGRYEDARTYLSAAANAPGDCEDAFSEMGVSSPVTKEDGDCYALCAISQTIVASL